MIIFIIASGLTLVFGLMDVLNFGHGVFIALGAFVATSVLARHGRLDRRPTRWRSTWRRWSRAMLAAMAVAGALGWAFERVIVRPVYGQHLKQILITMGGMIVGEELIKVHLGPAADRRCRCPTALRGALHRRRRGDREVPPAGGGRSAWWCSRRCCCVLNRTKIGLLIRAGVQDREMVEALGYRIRRLFVGVFVAGSALAGLGGVMWGLYQQSVTPQIGAQVNVLVFIVIIIGGLGSTLRLLRRRAAGRADGQLHRLPGAEGGAVLQHRADGGDPAVAAAGPVSGDEPMRPPMLNRLLSHDLPRSRWLALALLVVIVLGLALAPFLFPGAKALNVAAKICVFILLVASYDLLLGYTGIVTFAHTMFFGIGAYGVAIASTRLGAELGRGGASGIGVGAARCRWLLSLLIGLFSLRVKAIFFAMITLAVASAFLTLASQLSRLHRRRGRPAASRCPSCCSPAFEPFDEPLSSASRSTAASSPTTCCSSSALRAVPGAAAHRQLALRPRAAGDPRERLPRRGDRLPHRRLPHAGQRAVGAVRHAGRRAARAVAALHRARHHAVASRSCSTSC